MTRANTLVLALLVLNALLGGLCIAIGRGERRSRALSLWGTGTLLYAAGLLITIPAWLPFDLRKVVGNGLIAYSPIPLVMGILSFTTLRLSRRWVLAAFVATMLPIVVNHLGGHYQVLVDILMPAPLANVLFLLTAVTLIRRPPPEARTPARFAAAIFLFGVGVWSLRMWAIYASIGATNDRDRADLTIALFGIAQMVVSVALTLAMLWIEVQLMAAALRGLAETDALTGLPNRRATMQRFEDELVRARRHVRGFALLVLDIDHFKRINDGLGHAAGDLALQHIAGVLSSERRSADALGRLGGEEFVVVLGETDEDGAVMAAERIRARLAESSFQHEGTPVAITVSGGISVYPYDGSDWSSLFAAADQRLYAAKRGGRNRIVASEGIAVAS